MKTAVSIPDPLFDSAERFAARRGFSRSELYANALREYLEGHGTEGLTEKLDEVYGEGSGGLDLVISEMQGRSLSDEGW